MRMKLLKHAFFGLTTFTINIRYILQLRATIIFYHRRHFLHTLSIGSFVRVLQMGERVLSMYLRFYVMWLLFFCLVLPESEIYLQNLKKNKNSQYGIP